MISKAKKVPMLEVKELLAVDKKDITMEYIRSLFACHIGQPEPKYNTYDTFTLPKGTYYNDTELETTVGKYIFNKVVLPETYLKKYGYCNLTMNKDNIGDVEKKMGAMILNDKMTTKEYATYLDNGEWLGMGTAYFLSPTMDYDINVPIPEVIELRDQLFEKYKDGVKRGDSAVAEKIEKEVLALAKSKIKAKGNEAYDFFESGVGKFGNNYKKTSIMAGAIENPYTKKLDILKSNYIDGVDPKEFPKFASLTLAGGYSRGVATQSSGYQRKKIDNGLQGVKLDEVGSDCGTKQTIDIIIPKSLKSIFVNRYIVENGRLVELTNENIGSYIDKPVKLRSPMCCKGDKICNICAGNLFYKMGVRNIGLFNDNLAGTLLNASMKKFHDATVKFSKINISDYIKKQ